MNRRQTICESNYSQELRQPRKQNRPTKRANELLHSLPVSCASVPAVSSGKLPLADGKRKARASSASSRNSSGSWSTSMSSTPDGARARPSGSITVLMVRSAFCTMHVSGNHSNSDRSVTSATDVRSSCRRWRGHDSFHQPIINVCVKAQAAKHSFFALI